MDLKTLSNHLGLSKTTVSRALNGYPDVSLATRTRVREAAERLGYRPNPVAQALQSGRAQAIGLVLPTGPGEFGDPFLLALLTGAGKELQADGLDLMVSAAAPGDDELAALDRMISKRRVDGVIVVRTRADDPRIHLLLDRDFPFVAQGRTREPRPYPFLDVDGVEAFERATTTLIELGHRRIALIGGEPHLAYATHRRQGYEAAMAAAGLRIDPDWRVEARQTREAGLEAAKTLIALRPRPTAILCNTDTQAVGCLAAIAEAGLTAGVDVSVIGHDDLPLASVTSPPLATMAQPLPELGARLGRMMLQRLAGKPASELQELWTAAYVPRASAGPAPPDDRTRRQPSQIR